MRKLGMITCRLLHTLTDNTGLEMILQVRLLADLTR